MTLIERLEAATGPDRELDVGVALVSGWHSNGLGMTLENMSRILSIAEIATEADSYTSILSEIPKFTASIDAAMTLVPDGLMFTVSLQDEGKGAASIFRRNSDGERETCCGLSIGATPALAICIAAIEARED